MCPLEELEFLISLIFTELTDFQFIDAKKSFQQLKQTTCELYV